MVDRAEQWAEVALFRELRQSRAVPYSSGNRNSILIALSYATTECRICTAILRLLRDKSNDVQAIPLNMLGVLLMKVKEEQVLEIANSSAN